MPRRFKIRPEHARGFVRWPRFAWAVLIAFSLASAEACARKPSEEFRQAVALHQELVAAYQYDCFARPEYGEVARKLATVKPGQPEYAESQAMLRRYAEEKEKILGAQALAAKEAEAEARAAAAMKKGYETAAEYYQTKIDAGEHEGDGADGRRGRGAKGQENEGEPLGPGGYVIVGNSAAESSSPSKGVVEGAPETAVDQETLRQRRIDAGSAWKCYSSTYGSPRASADSRYKIRLGETPGLKLAGSTIRTLSDLRGAIRVGVPSGRERDELLTLLAPYPDEVLSQAEARFNPMSFLLITHTPEGYQEVDFLREYDRCYGTTRYAKTDPNPPGRSPAEVTGGAQSFRLPFADFGSYSLSVWMVRRPEGVVMALDCQTRRGKVEVCRFTLPRMTGASAGQAATVD